VFLVGGALLSRGPDLAASTAELLDAIQDHFDAKLTTPRRDLAGACELPDTRGQAAKPALLEHLAFREDFTWVGRPVSEYKADDALPFRDVTRHELLGRFGEGAAFDLRYFEVGPGGYSSCEKHAHTHAIIAVRGKGVLVVGDKRYDLRPLDIAHVPPLAAHQLRNEAADEPFGFFCIVDHERDRPQPAG
jgi:ribulose-bisphosphate carboxylase large chain